MFDAAIARVTTKRGSGKVDRPGALVLGGAHGSLAVARSLGRQDIAVWILSDDHPIAGLSRYAARHGTWPGSDDPQALAWLIAFAHRHGLLGWTLFAGGDSEVRLIARNHEALGSIFRLTTPPLAIARWALDKRLTHRHASSIGLASPWSFYPRNRDDLSNADIAFPVIVKPMFGGRSNAFTRAKAWRADDFPTLLARYDEAAQLVEANAIGIQELIPGGGEAQFSYAGVWSDGAPIAFLTARRTRQFPVDFGYTSTFVETIDDPEIEASATRFLSTLRFSGIAEVEFKRDSRDGRCKLLDVNMRPWTWIALGLPAGVDFPLLAWRIAQGVPVQNGRGRSGVAWSYLSRDVAAVARQIVSGKLALGAYLADLRRAGSHAAFARDDILPSLADLPLSLARGAMRRRAVQARSPVHRPGGGGGRDALKAALVKTLEPPRSRT